MNPLLDSGLFINGIRLRREAVSSFEEYPFVLPAIKGLSRLPLRTPVTIFVGENGSGKSTLLEAIASAWGFNPEGGTLNFTFATRSSHSPLHEFVVLERGIKRPKDGFFLRAESFYNVATEIERLIQLAALADVSSMPTAENPFMSNPTANPS